MKRQLLGLALAPGLDAMRAALLEVVGQGLELRADLAASLVEPLPGELTLRLRQLLAGTMEPRSFAFAHRAVGEAAATCACRLADRAQVRLSEILACGFFPLILHHEGEGPTPTQLALGSAAILAERTGISMASDFASRDLAAGGHGTPLFPIVDHLLLSHEGQARAVVHLGAQPSVTWLPADGDLRGVRAAEAGPGVAFLSNLLRQLSGGKERDDAAGHFAVQGRCLPDLLERWRKHPFHLKRWPKSTPRSTFGEEFAKQTIALAQQKQWDGRDLLCTAHHWVADAVGAALRHVQRAADGPTAIVVTGAGTRNGLLLRLLEEAWPEVSLLRSDDVGWPSELWPAIAAAVLTALLLDQEPGNLPAATGASGARLLGQWTPGSGLNWSECLAVMTGQTLVLHGED